MLNYVSQIIDCLIQQCKIRNSLCGQQEVLKTIRGFAIKWLNKGFKITDRLKQRGVKCEKFTLRCAIEARQLRIVQIKLETTRAMAFIRRYIEAG